MHFILTSLLLSYVQKIIKNVLNFLLKPLEIKTVNVFGLIVAEVLEILYLISYIP